MKLTNAASKKLKKIFDEIDSQENDNRLDLDEIVDCCGKLNVNISQEDIDLFVASDTDNDGKLSFDEFCDFTLQRLQRIFNEIDSNGNGSLDVQEIQDICKKMDVTMSRRQIESILAEMDADTDGKVDFTEFCDFFADMPSPDLQLMTQKWIYGEGLDIGSDMAPTALPPKEMPLVRFMAAGGIAGIASRSATAPLETLKIIAQTSSKGKIKLSDTFRTIIRDGGVKGLFNGNLTNCLRVFPTSAIACIVYSRMIKFTPVDSKVNPQQPLWRFLSGATAGMISTTFTHPLDVVRARLTIQPSGGSSRSYTGIWHCINRVCAEEGARGLFRGLNPTLLTIGPFMGLQQTIYDIMKLRLLSDVSSPYVCLACGALAGTAAQTAVHPLDVVRRQMQVSTSSSSLLEMLTRLWRQGGVPRFFAGITPAYLKVVPAASISLLVRDAILGKFNIK